MTLLVIVVVVALVIGGAIAVAQQKQTSVAVERGDAVIVKRYPSSFSAQGDMSAMAKRGYRVTSQSQAKVMGSKHGVLVTYERTG